MLTEEQEIEERIFMEIIVDCHDEYERYNAWMCYLDDMLKLPFNAKFISSVNTSPLRIGDEFLVKGLDSSCELDNKVYVEIDYDDSTLSVPLSQIEAITNDKETLQAISDWHYWVNNGYQV
jgi:hypothetical protein